VKNRNFAMGLAAGLGAAWAAGRLARTRHAISFDGRVVVLTGGSRGLGLVMARMLVDEGAKLVLLARDLSELERAREDLETSGRGEVMTIRCDVRRRADVRAAIDTVLDEWRSVDVLIKQVYRANAQATFQAYQLAFHTQTGFHFTRMKPDAPDFRLGDRSCGSSAGYVTKDGQPTWFDLDEQATHPLEFYPHYMKCLIAYGEERARQEAW